MTERADWPPEGFIVIGDYAFEPPLVPSELQLQQAEEFVFTQVVFENLREGQRRRNVIRLAIAAAADTMLSLEEGSVQKNFVPLLGGVVEMTSQRHDESSVISYKLLGGGSRFEL